MTLESTPVSHDYRPAPLVEGGFEHKQYAHCESGVSSNLFEHSGVPLSEAMTFGIGSGLFFVHLPFVKVMGLPLTSYRSMPASIFKKACRRLGVAPQAERFRSPTQGQRRLDELLEQGRVVAVQTNIFWLPYMPERFRFPFNAHNLIVYGKSEKEYFISDPILEGTALCPEDDLTRARFRKGPLAPKGLIYYIDAPAKISDSQMRRAVFQGLKETTHRMLYIPVPIFGGKAIKLLASRIEKWHQSNDARRFSLLITNVVRMQEEIGTGGAGFRFLFAKFLEEAHQLFPGGNLQEASEEFFKVGDKWRNFAREAVRFAKRDYAASADVTQLSDLLRDIYESERKIFKDIHFDFIKKQKL